MSEHLKTEELNNYEKWCEQWRKRFLEMDQEELKKKLPELKEEGEWLTLFHFSRKFGVHKTKGEIVALEDEEAVSCYEKLNIYTLFAYVSSGAYFKDNWVKFEQLKDASPFAKAFQAGVNLPFAKTFQGHMQELEEAFKQLNGRKLPMADVGYELDAFGCIPVRFLFWEGDEEFQSSSNLLFDISATEYIHVESMVTIAVIALARLAKLANLPLDRAVFPIF